MTLRDLEDIEAGLKRWHSVSTDTAQKLVDALRKSWHDRGMLQMHIDLVEREKDEAYEQLDLFRKNTNIGRV